MTGRRRACSLSRNAAISAGVVGQGDAPRSPYRVFTIGSASALAVSALTCATSSAGMFAGPIMAVHEVIAYPGSTSAMAGTSGSSGMRVLDVTAIGLIRPARTLGSEPGKLSNSMSTRPPSRSFSAGPAPLYGIWTTSTPAMLFIISPERCNVVPNPADA
jgi:hypothetical protein